MIRVNANIFRRAMLLLSLIVLPSVVLGDAGHDAKKEPAGMEGMDHSKMKMDGHGDAADAHWMAPDEAAKRPNPVKADKASVARGKKLFETNCASCHSNSGKGDGPAAKALNPKPVDLAAMAGQHPDGDFAWKIENGRGPMPAWKGTLTQNQIWDLVNYVQSLGPKNQKPSAHAHPPGHAH